MPRRTLDYVRHFDIPPKEGVLVLISDCRFAVVDIETTGLYSGRDRIIEVAIVTLTADGTIIDEFDTLVNPEMSILNSHVHGITNKDVADAPVFETIASEVRTRLENCVVVAHNLSFDESFLADELEVPDEDKPWEGMCTMRLGPRILGSPGKPSLATICDHLGIDYTTRHRALGDARACAEVLRRILGVVAQSELTELEDLTDLQFIEAKRKKGAREKLDMGFSWMVAPESVRDGIGPTSQLVGMSVCFTGESQIIFRNYKMTRSMLEGLSLQAGLKVMRNVSKKCNILVCARPDSTTGKMVKAQELGLKVMSEHEYFTSLGLPFMMVPSAHAATTGPMCRRPGLSEPAICPRCHVPRKEGDPTITCPDCGCLLFGTDGAHQRADIIDATNNYEDFPRMRAASRKLDATTVDAAVEAILIPVATVALPE